MLDSRLRVLLIAPSSEIVGGQSRQATALLEHLSTESGVRVDFLAVDPRFRRGLLQRLQKIRYLRTFLNTASYIGVLAAGVRKYDLIHIFTAAYYSFLLVAAPVLILARLFGVKTVVHYHDGRAEDHLIAWRSAVPLLRLASAIAVPSPFLSAVFGRFGFATQKISNVLELERFTYRLRSQLRPVFLHNRGMEPEYNVECTLRAFAIVQKRFPEARLIMAHDGSLRKKLEALAARLGLRNVQFIGAVSATAMSDLYQSADIFLTSANYDNMPGSVLESFASGLPVVATRAGGTEWIVRNGDNGLLVPCGDFEAMAASAIRLIDDPDLAVRLATSARRDCSQYTWEQIGSKWLELYQRLVMPGNVAPNYVAESSQSRSVYR